MPAQRVAAAEDEAADNVRMLIDKILSIASTIFGGQ
jgi:hypothetical protein